MDWSGGELWLLFKLYKKLMQYEFVAFCLSSNCSSGVAQKAKYSFIVPISALWSFGLVFFFLLSQLFSPLHVFHLFISDSSQLPHFLFTFVFNHFKKKTINLWILLSTFSAAYAPFINRNLENILLNHCEHLNTEEKSRRH